MGEAQRRPESREPREFWPAEARPHPSRSSARAYRSDPPKAHARHPRPRPTSLVTAVLFPATPTFLYVVLRAGAFSRPVPTFRNALALLSPWGMSPCRIWSRFSLKLYPRRQFLKYSSQLSLKCLNCTLRLLLPSRVSVTSPTGRSTSPARQGSLRDAGHIRSPGVESREDPYVPSCRFRWPRVGSARPALRIFT